MIDLHTEPREDQDDLSHSGFRTAIKRESKKITGSLGRIVDEMHELTSIGTNTIMVVSGIAQSIEHIALAQMKQARIMHVYWGDDGILQAAPNLGEEVTGSAPLPKQPVYIEAETKVHGGTGGPVGWVSRAPSPYQGVVIVCSPDSGEPVGIRCHAEVNRAGGVREKYHLQWTKREDVS